MFTQEVDQLRAAFPERRIDLIVAGDTRIAREIAQSHGGAIDARSDETGTVFAVRLPRRSR